MELVLVDNNKNTDKSIKYNFLLWVKNVKQNKLGFICRLILYVFQVLVVKYSFIERLNENFCVFLSILVIICLVNELSKIKEIKEKEQLKKQIELKNDRIEDLEVSTEYLGQVLSCLPEDFLREVSHYLGLNNSYRVSLYVFNEINFEIIGRYSENPLYDAYRREKYPINEGYIAKCFENNNGKPYFIRDDLPKNTQQIYFQKVSKETGMSIESIRNLSMKSRAYFARLVKDDNKNNVGILLIETINPKFNLKPDDLNLKIEKLVIPHIKTLLEISNKLKEDGAYEK